MCERFYCGTSDFVFKIIKKLIPRKNSDEKKTFVYIYRNSNESNDPMNGPKDRAGSTFF